MLDCAPVILRCAANPDGRDLILSDVHGNRRGVDALLARAKFDPAKDRVFSVGDLTDRGDENFRCLELLREPWFFPVLGNHDFNIMLVGYAGEAAEGAIPPGIPGTDQSPFPRPPWDIWGFLHMDNSKWVAKLSSAGWDYLREWSDVLRAVPHVRVVGEGDARFHVVHAGLHPQEMITDDNAATNMMVDNNGYAKNPPWGTLGLFTHRYRTFSDLSPNRLSTTYCGHTVVPRVTRFAQHVNIDTGSGKGGKLTLLCHHTQEVWDTV